MPTLKERADQLTTKRIELKNIFDEHKTDKVDERGSPIFDETIPIVEINTRNAELATLTDSYEAAKAVDTSYQENLAAFKGLTEAKRGYELPAGSTGQEGEVKSLQAQFTESPQYIKRASGIRDAFAIELKGSVKTLLSTGNGYAPFSPRQDLVIYTPQRRAVIADLIPQDDTEFARIVFMEEVLFNNAATAVAEGATKPEAGLQYVERSYNMTKIAVTLPVTDEQLTDVPQIEALLKNRLGLMVMLEEDNELLNGTGAGNQLLGFLNKPGILNTPKGAMDIFTAAFVAQTNVADVVGFADPNGWILNPTNWVAYRTLKDTTGRFILGDPGQVGEARLWGLPVISTVAMPAGTALTGDFKAFSHIDRKMGLRIDVGYVNDQFLRNQQTIRAEERMTLEIYRAQAFSTVTGLPNGPV